MNHRLAKRISIGSMLGTCLLGSVLATGSPAAAQSATCAGVQATIVGTEGDDQLMGTPGRDVIAGLGGNDRILGLSGADVICGGAGDDDISAGPGRDRVYGGPGDDIALGNGGPDVLHGNLGDDRLVGGPGNDRLFSGAGQDILNGGSGVDLIFGRQGDNQLSGGSGDDRFRRNPKYKIPTVQRTYATPQPVDAETPYFERIYESSIALKTGRFRLTLITVDPDGVESTCEGASVALGDTDITYPDIPDVANRRRAARAADIENPFTRITFSTADCADGDADGYAIRRWKLERLDGWA